VAQGLDGDLDLVALGADPLQAPGALAQAARLTRRTHTSSATKAADMSPKRTCFQAVLPERLAVVLEGPTVHAV
jgi:hypothetical protein